MNVRTAETSVTEQKRSCDVTRFPDVVVSKAGSVPAVKKAHGTVPAALLPLTWAMMPLLLRLAGADFASSQDRPFGIVAGDAAMQASKRAGAIWQYAAAVIACAVVAPYVRAAVRCAFKDRLHLVLLAWVTASVMWSQDPLTTVKQLLWLYISVAFVYWMRARLSARQQMELTMTVGTVAALLSIAVVILVPSRGLDTMHENVWQGIFYSKNHMGRIFLFLLSPAPFWKPQTQIGRFLPDAYIALMLLMIAMSGSASAWLITAIFLALTAAMKLSSRISRREIGPVVGVALLLVVVAGGLLIANAGQILQLMGRNLTLTGRTKIWDILLISIGKRPLIGYGYQAFWSAPTGEGMNVIIAEYGMLHFLGSYAHSGYFATALEEGLIGVLLLVLLLGRSVRHAFVCLRDSQWLNEAYWYISIVIITILYNIDEVTVLLPGYLPWMLCLLAMSSLAAKSRSGLAQEA